MVKPITKSRIQKTLKNLHFEAEYFQVFYSQDKSIKIYYIDQIDWFSVKKIIVFITIPILYIVGYYEGGVEPTNEGPILKMVDRITFTTKRRSYLK